MKSFNWTSQARAQSNADRTFQKFQKEHPDLKRKQRKFESLKTFFVKGAKERDQFYRNITYFNWRNVSESILKDMVDLHHNLTDFDKFHIFSLCYTNVHHDCATHHNGRDKILGKLRLKNPRIYWRLNLCNFLVFTYPVFNMSFSFFKRYMSKSYSPCLYARVYLCCTCLVMWDSLFGK